MESRKSKLIHDMNSNLSALMQSLSILQAESDHVLCQQLHPLCLEKMEKMIIDWEEVKSFLKEESK